jgi:hypothetical protein
MAIFVEEEHLTYLYPFIKPIVNPRDILLVNGMPKFDIIANEEAVAVWIPSTLLPLIPGICIVRFESVVIAASDTV